MDYNKMNAKIYSRLGHRGSFAMTLMELAQTHDKLSVMTADLASLTGLDRFVEKYPDKFYNLGIAEQNMVGVASGMARDGFTVFATTYANFITMRSFEQIRMNLGYMKANVKIVGTGAGISVSMSGNSHYGLEDIAIMRAIPNMTVVAPCDGFSISKCVIAAANNTLPMFIRLTGVQEFPIVYGEDFDFEIGKSILLTEGKDVTVFACGTLVAECLKAEKLLAEKGVSVAVVDMHTIKPLDEQAVKRAYKSDLIVTVEEHSIVGGLGGAVAECKAKDSNAPPQLILGLPDIYGKAGEYWYLLEKYGLTAEKIAKRIFDELRK
jgi:transketolase